VKNGFRDANCLFRNFVSYWILEYRKENSTLRLKCMEDFRLFCYLILIRKNKKPFTKC